MTKEFASDQEKHFSWYIQELIEEGFIRKVFYQPKSKVIAPAAKYEVEEQMKTKTKIITRQLLPKISYTPDWKIYWADKANGVFHECIQYPIKNPDIAFFSNIMNGEYVSIIDVKGDYAAGNQRGGVDFAIKQKWIWHEFNIYVQKVVVTNKAKKQCIFEKTFTPHKFLFTDKKMDRKKIHYKIINIRQYLESIGK